MLAVLDADPGCVDRILLDNMTRLDPTLPGVPITWPLHVLASFKPPLQGWIYGSDGLQTIHVQDGPCCERPCSFAWRCQAQCRSHIRQVLCCGTLTTCQDESASILWPACRWGGRADAAECHGSHKRAQGGNRGERECVAADCATNSVDGGCLHLVRRPHAFCHCAGHFTSHSRLVSCVS